MKDRMHSHWYTHRELAAACLIVMSFAMVVGMVAGFCIGAAWK